MTKDEVLEKLEEERESAKSKILYGQARNLSVKRYRWHFNRVNYAIALVEKLDEPEKVVIPQFVADWIEKAKIYFGDEIDPLRIIDWVDDHVSIGPHYEWTYNIDNQKLLLNAIANGYEVEKKPEYRVRVKGISTNQKNLLRYHTSLKTFELAGVSTNAKNFKTEFTKQWLKDNWAGFNTYNNAGLLEFEEVEDD